MESPYQNIPDKSHKQLTIYNLYIDYLQFY